MHSILTSKSNLLNLPTVAFVDNKIGYLRIMPQPSYVAGATAPMLPIPDAKVMTATTNTRIQNKAGLKEEKVPRPPNAFILYRQHHHDMVKNANPELHNNDIC
jgi:hypothetical protein